MKKRAIPKTPSPGEDRAAFDQAVRENLQIIMGERAGRIAPLGQSATLSEVIAKMNEILVRLQ